MFWIMEPSWVRCIGIEMEKHEDPLRSWTEKMENGKFLVVNGSQLVHHFSLLEIMR